MKIDRSMLFNLYYSKDLGTPWISIILIMTCSIVWAATIIDNNLWHVFATHSRPVFFWQYFSGLFQHNFFPRWFYTIHFATNIIVIVLFGVLIERILGTIRFLFLNIFSGSTGILYFFLNSNIDSTFSGISVIVWSYAPIVFIVLLQLYKIDKKLIKEKMFFLMVSEIIFMWVFVTVVDFSGSNTSNDNHLVATITGIVFWLIYKKDLKRSISDILDTDFYCQKKRGGRAIILLVSLLPICVVSVIGLYLITGLSDMFVNVVKISPAKTIEEINNNGSKIEIEFDSPFTEKGITSYSLKISSPEKTEYSIVYSEKRFKAAIVFTRKLSEKTWGQIRIEGGSFVNNKKLKAFEISFK